MRSSNPTPTKHPSRGFTLIELMIVVAIIGILSAVSLPKFADMVRKSKEAATRGHLGSIRSAITIYYADTEGNYPSLLETLILGQKYLNEIPPAWTYEYGQITTITNGP